MILEAREIVIMQLFHSFLKFLKFICLIIFLLLYIICLYILNAIHYYIDKITG